MNDGDDQVALLCPPRVRPGREPLTRGRSAVALAGDEQVTGLEVAVDDADQ
jgi:hypothetical protein